MNPSVILNTAAEETYQYFVFELWVNNLMTHIFSINFVWEAYQRYCLLLTLSLPVDKFMMPIKQTQRIKAFHGIVFWLILMYNNIPCIGNHVLSPITLVIAKHFQIYLP